MDIAHEGFWIPEFRTLQDEFIPVPDLSDTRRCLNDQQPHTMGSPSWESRNIRGAVVGREHRVRRGEGFAAVEGLPISVR